jgi:Protein of unknown function (DUF3800)
VLGNLYRGDAFVTISGAGGSAAARERPVIVLQCYLDDSGSRDLPVVTLGGFLSTLQNWEAVEPRLNVIMDRAGIPVFHAKEFHSTKRPFSGWSRLRKQSFADEIFSATRGLLMSGHSWTIKRAAMLQAQKDAPKSFGRMSPLCFCFSAIVMSIVTSPFMSSLVKANGLAFLIESGNTSNAGIDQFFDRMAKHPVFEGVIRSMSFVPKSSCRAIQIADFFVFYSRRQMRNNLRFDGKLLLPSCRYIDTIRKYVSVDQRGGIGDPKFVAKNTDFDTSDELAVLVDRAVTS